MIVAENHTNKGHKMLKIQTRREDSSITHSTSPVKDTSLGEKLEKNVISKKNLNHVLLPENLSWEP